MSAGAFGSKINTPWPAKQTPQASAVHDEPAVDAESLTRHVRRTRRHKEPDHIRNVLGALHAPQRDLANASAGELFRRLLEQRCLFPDYGGPHICLDEAGANAVYSDPVSGVSHREALGQA